MPQEKCTSFLGKEGVSVVSKGLEELEFGWTEEKVIALTSGLPGMVEHILACTNDAAVAVLNVLRVTGPDFNQARKILEGYAFPADGQASTSSYDPRL